MTATLPPAQEQAMQTLTAHIMELRKRILWCFLAMVAGTLVSFMFKEDIFSFLVQPFADAMHRVGGTNRMISTASTEIFMTYLRVSFFAGCFLTFPFLLWQVWMFVAPGLYKNEKKVFLPYLVATPVLFFLGGAMVYYLIMPAAWTFLLHFQSTGENTALRIDHEQSVGEYLSIVMTLIFVFGISFQLPVLMTLMARAGILGAQSLRKFRKYAIVAIFAVAAVITPPDVFSQIALAVPLCLLYEFSILLVSRIEKARNARTS
jgi:sec-independent protein translocase protein TatC